MYKAMHQNMRSSEKLAELSDFAYRVWSLGVVASDMVGRISANPRKYHAEAMPLLDFEESKTRAAFNQMEALKLVHPYDVDGKPYYVFHDHDEHNKGTKNLRNLKPVCPPPMQSVCYCVVYTTAEEGDSSVLVVTEPSEQQPERAETRPVIRHLLQRAKEAKIAGRKETLLSYLESWVARTDAQRVEQNLMDPWSRGKTILELQNHFFGNGDANGVPSVQEILTKFGDSK